ncbi:MAG: hypothetical protein RMJ98_17025 [Myxococcales bacterium]|nr:hypothetical protein [Polyangiaceae bacterium]MDW8250999.1 hypothetical protein [Myxococcales bacterium]
MVLVLAWTPGCGEEDENKPEPGASAGSGGSGQAGNGGSGQAGSGGLSGGLQPFTTPADPGNGGILVTVSGEDLAINGYPFISGTSKSEGDPPAFVDGWEVKFNHFLVTIGSVTLHDNPDKNPDDPKDMGALVAEATGPFAVDLSIGGPIVGKSGSPDEKTVAIAAFTGPASGGKFQTDQRYAISYTTVAATAQARNVNLDAEGLVLYQQAIAKGWVMALQGKATYKGKPPKAGSVFEKMPREVTFTLGFANPASYLNCQNTDLTPVGDEEFPRGVQVSAGDKTIAQITWHSDHIFWNKLNVEGTPLHFDPIAAAASTYGSKDAPPGVTTMEDLDALDFLAFKTRDGEPLPWRSEVEDFTPPEGTLAFDGNGVTFPKNSFGHFLRYSATSGGHFNANGECEVVLNFTP